MEKTKNYLLFGAIAALTFICVVLLTDRIKTREDAGIYSRDIDTVYTGAAPNDGTGMPLQTAWGVFNDLANLCDTLDIDSLTRAMVMALRDMEDLTDAVLFHVGDTTVTAAVGKVVFKTSDGTFYGCVRATPTTRWEAFN